PQQNSEVNADCWAIKTIRNLGIIQNQQQITQLLNYIFTLPGSMQGHLPGPARAQNIYWCFNT
ncbi:hypothetical protein VB509_24650, partial [Vibrio parahaemolyticus]|nr:hypothetical protein [Vibrio parahaemolyticus]